MRTLYSVQFYYSKTDLKNEVYIKKKKKKKTGEKHAGLAPQALVTNPTFPETSCYTHAELIFISDHTFEWRKDGM